MRLNIACTPQNKSSEHTVIDAEKIKDFADLVSQIDSIVCLGNTTFPLLIKQNDWAFEIQNRCLDYHACYLKTSLAISNKTKDKISIHIDDTNHQVAEKMKYFLLNPDKIIGLASTPSKGIFHVDFSKETGMNKLCSQLKRMIEIYNSIEEFKSPMRLEIYNIPAPPPSPPSL